MENTVADVISWMTLIGFLTTGYVCTRMLWWIWPKKTEKYKSKHIDDDSDD